MRIKHPFFMQFNSLEIFVHSRWHNIKEETLPIFEMQRYQTVTAIVYQTNICIVLRTASSFHFLLWSGCIHRSTDPTHSSSEPNRDLRFQQDSPVWSRSEFIYIFTTPLSVKSAIRQNKPGFGSSLGCEWFAEHS